MSDFALPLRVYIEDTDAGGIVYYVNYLKFMERARTEFMRHLGYDKTAIFSHQAMFVVHSVDVKYKAPAKLDDELSSELSLLKVANTYMVFEQKVCKEGQILCAGQVKIACVEREALSPIAMPKEMKEKLKAFIQ